MVVKGKYDSSLGIFGKYPRLDPVTLNAVYLLPLLLKLPLPLSLLSLHTPSLGL